MTDDAAGRAPLGYSEIAELRARVVGPVSLPDDPGYSAESATFNLADPVRPAVAVGAADTTDVRAAVRFAAALDLPVAVLNSGHQMPRSAEGAVLINLSRLNGVHVSSSRDMARVGGGARWAQVLPETDPHDLAPLSGSSPTVGVTGYHLGGGASPVLGRAYGYAADHVQAIELVTADGEFRRVTASAEPDLFWALRGGKSNFGVVTALEFSLFPVPRFYGGGLFFAAEHAPRVLHAWAEWVNGLPPEAFSYIAFLSMPPLPTIPQPLRGKFVFHLVYTSLKPNEEAERTLAPMRGLAPTMMESMRELRYREGPSVFMDPPEPLPVIERSTMLRDFPAEAADALLAVAGPDSGTRLNFVGLRLLGGAMARPPAVPNAIAGRNAQWAFFGVGSDPAQAPLIQEDLTTLMDALSPWAQDEVMNNLLSSSQGTTPEELRTIYGPERYDRLATIKTHYDPNNLFRMNHNIPPA